MCNLEEKSTTAYKAFFIWNEFQRIDREEMKIYNNKTGGVSLVRW